MELQDESTAELEASLADIEEINRKVRANMDKDKAEDEALDYKNQYNALTTEIDKTRKAKTELLQSAELPLPELSVKDGELMRISSNASPAPSIRGSSGTTCPDLTG